MTPPRRLLCLAGGKGVISVVANVAPGACMQLCEAARRGDRQQVEK